MKRLKIKGIQKEFEIVGGNIYDLNIENVSFYHRLLLAFSNDDSDLLFLSQNYASIDYSKESLFISDILSLNPNSKKILNSLYKKIQDQYIRNSHDNLQIINTNILSLLDEISFDLNIDVDYSTDLSLSDILSLYKFSFREDNDSFLCRFITYIKANLEIRNISFVVSLNLLPLLKEQEVLLLKRELEMLGVCLLNFNIFIKHCISGVEYITIDNDLCEF